MRFSPLSVMLLALCLLAGRDVMQAAEPLPETISFNRHIRPILSENCYQCHGPDTQQRKADLRLDLSTGAFADLGGYQAVQPGKPAASAMYERITETDLDLVMPPPKLQKTLSDREKALIKKWIEQGGKYEQHWSFVPPTRPALPQVSQPDWIRNPIDRFVLARLDRESLKPSSETSKRTLIRRVTLDLTGLPPTPEEVDAFLQDDSPQAYEQVVDRLLKSPRYGEHLARYWLDASRYADTNGYQYDLEREQWAWRDWVIHAFNNNMPFDQFTIEQLAGDLLPNATDDQKLATGFNRNHPITIEGGVIDEEYRTEYVVDRVVTTSTVWMGMTFLCARCHDHKYDPIPQQEFYQFFAYFNQVPERGLNGFEPRIKVLSPLQRSELTKLKKELPDAERTLQATLEKFNISLAKLERELQEKVQQEWTVLRPQAVTSKNGATLTLLEDDSVLASGKNPATDVYETTLDIPDGKLTALRLEALTHPSLPHNGAARGFNGNFVLTEVQVEVASANQPQKFRPVKITSAAADYSQQSYHITAAIDGTATGRGGWAVDGPTKRENRTAFFFLQDGLTDAKGLRVRIRLIHTWGGSHQIGRFRWSVTDTKQLSIPEPVRAAIAVPREQRTATQNAELDAYLLQTGLPQEARPVVDEVMSLRKYQAELQRQAPSTLVMRELPKPRQTHVLHRGEYNQKREVVKPGTPSVLPKIPAEFPQNRLGLAKWLVMPGHPLTARVTVNRFWQRMFGTGLVKTSEDFGSQGAAPSHPDLLDWLAMEFQESGWNVKHIHKLIVLSATYRQSSHATKGQHDRDPENRLLARGSRFRLDAEVIRDVTLSVSGLLHEQTGGPSVFPYHPKGLWQEINNRPGYSRTYKQGSGNDLYRRSMYTFWKRTVPPPALSIFDAPEREFCVVERSRTNTPLQALVLLHGPQYVEAAKFLGSRIKADDPEVVIQTAMQICLSRLASAAELTILQNYYESRLAHYQQHPVAIQQQSKVGDRKSSNRNAKDAAATDVARMILNLSEFITRE